MNFIYIRNIKHVFLNSTQLTEEYSKDIYLHILCDIYMRADYAQVCKMYEYFYKS